MATKSKIEINFELFENTSELPKKIQDLMSQAQKARENAYAPYSNFKVGAAILLDSEEMVIGSNQENAAYPSGLCAERVAVFQCGAVYPNQAIQALAITASSPSQLLKDPIGPCGACRQSLSEYEQRQDSPIPVYFMGEIGKIIKVASVKDLLPLGFDAKFL